MRRCIGLLLFYLLTFSFTSAQNETSGWVIEERCLEAEPQPSDWQFDGTILMRGRYGIHAYQDEWETPRVVISLDPEKALRGGALSPDGNWYAYPWGEFYVTETHNAVTSVNEIRVHSTKDAQLYIVPLYVAGYGGSYVQVYWIDNEHLLFANWGEPNGIVRINPFSGKMETWTEIQNIIRYAPYYLSPSPDWTALGAVYYPSENSTRSSWGIFVLEDEAFNLTVDNLSPVAWSPDSSRFAAYINRDLSIVSRDGTTIETVYKAAKANNRHTVLLDNIRWSSQDRYLTFTLSDSENDGYTHLFIADLQEQKVIDTCLQIGVGVAWSQDTQQLGRVCKLHKKA